MMDFLRSTWSALSADAYAPYVRAAIILVAGLVIARLVKRVVKLRQLRSDQLAVVRRFASGAVIGIAIASALAELGVNLSYLLGAAGVLTIAVGFAAQTAMSNLISGIFLLGERPFRVGDVIEVDGQRGTVLAIDLLSVKLRTPDNLMVRIPTESLLKSVVSNITHYPIRRLNLPIGVAYHEDLERVEDILHAVADGIPECLQEPAPRVIFLGFGDSSMNLQFSVWVTQEAYLDLLTGLPIAVKRAFDDAGVEIPFPQRTVHMPSARP